MADKKNITEKQFAEAVDRAFFRGRDDGRKQRPAVLGNDPKSRAVKPKKRH